MIISAHACVVNPPELLTFLPHVVRAPKRSQRFASSTIARSGDFPQLPLASPWAVADLNMVSSRLERAVQPKGRSPALAPAAIHDSRIADSPALPCHFAN
jgi:hypothetical protein